MPSLGRAGLILRAGSWLVTAQGCFFLFILSSFAGRNEIRRRANILPHLAPYDVATEVVVGFAFPVRKLLCAQCLPNPKRASLRVSKNPVSTGAGEGT